MIKRASLPTVVGYIISGGRCGYAYETDNGLAVHYDAAWTSASIPII